MRSRNQGPGGAPLVSTARLRRSAQPAEGFPALRAPFNRRRLNRRGSTDVGEQVDTEAALLVERGDRTHLLRAQLEVEDIDVLGHTLGAGRLRKDDHPLLHLPAQHHLRRRLPVRGRGSEHRRVIERTRAILAERRPASTAMHCSAQKSRSTRR